MKVRFRTNLGSIDAADLGLDHRECQYGKAVNVADEAAEILIARGIAEPAEQTVKGVAKSPAIAAPAVESSLAKPAKESK